MKRMMRHIFLFCCVFFAALLNAQVKVNAVLDSSKLRIGEQTKLDLYVTYDANAQKNLKIEWPSFEDTITGKVEIVSKTAIDSTIPDRSKPGMIQQHQQFIVSVYDSGYFAIPPFKFVVNGDTSNPLLTEALFLEVNTVPTDTTEASIRDIKAPFEEPFDWKWYLPYVYWGLGAIAVIIAAVLLIVKLTKKKPELVMEKKPEIPPHILALQQLDKVKAEAIWKEGKIKEYYSAISDSVRLYIEGRFGVQALELTTAEIVRAFRSQVVDPHSKEKLQQMLMLSDLVKFAKQTPIEQENLLVLQHAYDFVNGTKREEEIEIEEPKETVPTENSAEENK